MAKTWSYAAVTRQTETALMQYAELAQKNENGHGMLHVYRCMANGTYALWRDITSGWQNDGDDTRLRALADAVGVPAMVDGHGKPAENRVA